jgi:hypothetical protein
MRGLSRKRWARINERPACWRALPSARVFPAKRKFAFSHNWLFYLEMLGCNHSRMGDDLVISVQAPCFFRLGAALALGGPAVDREPSARPPVISPVAHRARSGSQRPTGTAQESREMWCHSPRRSDRLPRFLLAKWRRAASWPLPRDPGPAVRWHRTFRESVQS